MIKIKRLIKEDQGVDTLTAKDIYNFYYLWYIAVNQPSLVNTQYGSEVMNHYLNSWKEKYVRLFKKLLAKQIEKYIVRGRIDPDFPKNITPKLYSMGAKELQGLMAKTFRSDMQRRNDKWDMVADFVTKLESASSSKDKFVYINQLNNAVHNTNTKVMDKFPNFYGELLRAFDTVAKATNPSLQLKGYIDKDIRGLMDQGEPDNGGGEQVYNECIMMREGLEKILRLK